MEPTTVCPCGDSRCPYPHATRFERDLAAGRRAAEPARRADNVIAAMKRAADRAGYAPVRRRRPRGCACNETPCICTQEQS